MRVTKKAVQAKIGVINRAFRLTQGEKGSLLLSGDEIGWSLSVSAGNTSILHNALYGSTLRECGLFLDGMTEVIDLIHSKGG